MTANYFASFIDNTSEQVFVESKKENTRLFIQDNNQRQNCFATSERTIAKDTATQS